MNSEEKIKYISNWINKYANLLKFQPASLIIGVSGGIDSAVTSTLCAMTGFKTIAIPCLDNINFVEFTTTQRGANIHQTMALLG